jgi:hypothetical protein
MRYVMGWWLAKHMNTFFKDAHLPTKMINLEIIIVATTIQIGIESILWRTREIPLNIIDTGRSKDSVITTMANR